MQARSGSSFGNFDWRQYETSKIHFGVARVHVRSDKRQPFGASNTNSDHRTT